MPFQPGNKAHAKPDPETALKRQQRVEELHDGLYHMALHAERQETQLAAAVALLNRIEGKPLETSVTVRVDDFNRLTDAELERIARGGTKQDEPHDG